MILIVHLDCFRWYQNSRGGYGTCTFL